MEKTYLGELKCSKPGTLGPGKKSGEVMRTDTDRMSCQCRPYYINDTEDGFQCDEFDYYFGDLDSVAETLFNEKIIGKPVEIRVE